MGYNTCVKCSWFCFIECACFIIIEGYKLINKYNSPPVSLGAAVSAEQPLPRKTPTEDFRTVCRAMLANMVVRIGHKVGFKLTKKDLNVAGDHTRPLYEARHFV